MRKIEVIFSKNTKHIEKNTKNKQNFSKLEARHFLSHLFALIAYTADFE